MSQSRNRPDSADVSRHHGRFPRVAHDKSHRSTVSAMTPRHEPSTEPESTVEAPPDAATDEATPVSHPVSKGVDDAWLYTLGGILLYAAMLYGVGLVFMMARTPQVGTWAVILLLTVMAFGGLVIFCLSLRAGLWAGTANIIQVSALLVPALAISACSLSNPDWMILGQVPWVIAISALCCHVPKRHALTVLATGVAVAFGAVGLGHRLNPTAAQDMWRSMFPELWPTVFMTLITPLMVLLSVWWWGVILRLETARYTEADLAVTRERLRFASDLHDIQGHHLQVIALKAELAERLLDRDVEAARLQLRDARQEARTALEETRSLVHGLRQVTLDQELANAAEVLGAAGIRCTHRAENTPSSHQVRHLLGLVAREATTNILRHTKATSAAYDLVRDRNGRWTLTVTNDGAAILPTESPTSANNPGSNGGTGAAQAVGSTGTGLMGLRERLAAAQGTLTTQHSGGSFTLAATLPEPMGSNLPDAGPADSTVPTDAAGSPDDTAQHPTRKAKA